MDPLCSLRMISANVQRRYRCKAIFHWLKLRSNKHKKGGVHRGNNGINYQGVCTLRNIYIHIYTYTHTHVYTHEYIMFSHTGVNMFYAWLYDIYDSKWVSDKHWTLVFPFTRNVRQGNLPAWILLKSNLCSAFVKGLVYQTPYHTRTRWNKIWSWKLWTFWRKNISWCLPKYMISIYCPHSSAFLMIDPL